MGDYEPGKAREVLDTQIKEADFQRDVIQIAELNKWLVYHTYDSRRCKPGFPDLVLVKGKTVLFVELKGQRGRLSPDQKVWISALEKAEDVAVKVWKPQDWRDVERTLGGKDAAEKGSQGRKPSHQEKDSVGEHPKGDGSGSPPRPGNRYWYE
jgi:hypothetical protein